MEPKSSLRLLDVVVNLLKRDRVEEAISFQLDAIMMAEMNDLEIGAIMRMPIKDMVTLTSPLQVPSVSPSEEWDSVWYGAAAFEPRG